MLKTTDDIKRYELKYAVTEETASEIREYIKDICTLDKHVLPGADGYIINTLYFDTLDLRLYHDAKLRRLNRYKTRVRYYGIQPTESIWTEIKYRSGNIIWKRRCRVPLDYWPKLFEPELTKRRQPVIRERLDTFDDLVIWNCEQPTLHVRYYREPYVTELEEYGRLTFDRKICCAPAENTCHLEYNEQDMIYFDDAVNSREDDSMVILEIKVGTYIPEWVIELIRKFNLRQRPYSKYCYGIDSMMGFCPDRRNPIF
jgi:hypothetical protein